MRVKFGIFCLFATASSGAGSYTINTIAGSDWVGDGGPAIGAILLQSEGVAADNAGNVYIADASDHRVRRVAKNGTIETVAGTGVFGFSGDGGPAIQAQLNSPYGLALDAQGNLYIADLGNARIRRVALDGTISTIAGGGTVPAGGANDGSPATMVALSAPRNLAFDGSGNLYISDFNGERVYLLAPTGSLTTFAGTGAVGSAGDNGPATQAQLNHPAGLALDAQGSLYIADSGNHLVRRVTQGAITSYASASTPAGLAFDGLGNLYIADISAGDIVVIPPSGAASALPVPAVDVSVSIGAGIYASVGTEVLLVGADYSVAAVAGGGNLASGDGGPAIDARLNHPSGVAVDSSGNMYIADRDNNRIRSVHPDGTILTVAGNGFAGNPGDGGPALQAELNSPSSVTVDSSGNLYIADTGNARIRKVTPGGIISSVVSTGLLAPVYALVDATGTLYISDQAAGKILTAGSNGVPATLLSGLSSPQELALDSQGNLYFVEAGAARVSQRSPSGGVTQIGSGWSIPRGAAVDSSGDLFVADPGLEQVFEITSAGAVTAVAGTGTAGFSGDGGAATEAQLDFPWSLATGADGEILFADLENNRVRSLTPPAQPATNTTNTQPTTPPTNVTILNAASMAPGPVAAGMLVIIGGTGITAAQIGNTVVAFGSNPARILSADSTGILVVAPSAIAGSGSVTIEIIYQDNVIASIPVAVADAAPALFADSSGQAAANNQDGSLNSQSNPAARGSIVSLYGTGLGISDDPVSVTFANFTAQVLYAGPSAEYPGLFQINVQVPSGYLPTGDLAVVVTVGPSPSQSGVSIWVN